MIPVPFYIFFRRSRARKAALSVAYEILPGFVAGLIAAVVVTLCTKAPGADVEKLFDDALVYED